MELWMSKQERKSRVTVIKGIENIVKSFRLVYLKQASNRFNNHSSKTESKKERGRQNCKETILGKM